MNIVQITGGLGNQMLQYAFYVSMREKGIDCAMDASRLSEYLKSFNRDSIFNNFNVDNNFASMNDVLRLGDVKKDLFSKVRRKFFGKKKTHYVQKYSRDYLPNVYEMRDTYFEGYWFNVKYFGNYLNILRKGFTPKYNIDAKNLELFERIKKISNSVGIHVRLGDILNSVNYSSFGGICTQEYYNKAIEILKSKIKDCTFVVFSNEIDKCKQWFKGKEFMFIDNNNEYAGYIDLLLMSKCKHNIIANSTFSFWSAVLNENDNIVIAPKCFSNIAENRNDNCPEDWIRI